MSIIRLAMLLLCAVVPARTASGDFGVKRVSATAHTVTSGGAVLDSRSFTWDADHNKLERVGTRSGGPELSYEYAYDGRLRMTSVDPSNASPTAFTYDAAGNRTNTGYTLDGADALTNNYSATPFDLRGYDLLGNLASFNAREKYHTFDVMRMTIRTTTRNDTDSRSCACSNRTRRRNGGSSHWS
ncbi:MAG: hypothetical protein SGI88_11175 [Candidatus Hydrogenedentes bacterium]|nr:hypothetical protein [Candidatus Hydrogenedentota bacterium]